MFNILVEYITGDTTISRTTQITFRTPFRRKISVSHGLVMTPLLLKLWGGNYVYVEVSVLGEIIRQVRITRNPLINSKRLVSVDVISLLYRTCYPFIAISRYKRIIGKSYLEYGPPPGIKFYFDTYGIYYLLNGRIIDNSGRRGYPDVTRLVELSYTSELICPVLVWRCSKDYTLFCIYEGKTGVRSSELEFRREFSTRSGYLLINKNQIPNLFFLRAIKDVNTPLNEVVLYKDPEYETITPQEYKTLNVVRVSSALPCQAPGSYIITLDRKKYYLP